jgi:putative ABC transport system permease protein
VIGAGGAVIAVATAVALSPLTPMGLARRAELRPGVAADPAVLAPGALAVVALVAGCATVAAWRAARAPATALGVVEPVVSGRSSRVADALAAAGLPPTAVTGVRLVLEPGRGRTAVPVRTAIIGAAAAVCALAAASVFGASLARLAATPAAYGWTWDLSVGNFTHPAEVRRAAGVLDAFPMVSSYRATAPGPLLIDGHQVEVLIFERGRGTVPLQLLDGREPVRPDEIALGPMTMRTLGKHLGDTVAVAPIDPGKASQRLRVVGQLVLSAGPLDTAIAPGKGAVVDFEVLRRFYPEPDAAVPQAFFVRLDPAADHTQAVDSLQRSIHCSGRFPARSSVPSRTPTSPMSSASSTYPACSPPWWRFWPWVPSSMRWSARYAGAAAISPCSKRSASCPGRCRPRWPARPPPSPRLPCSSASP